MLPLPGPFTKEMKNEIAVVKPTSTHAMGTEEAEQIMRRSTMYDDDPEGWLGASESLVGFGRRGGYLDNDQNAL